MKKIKTEDSIGMALCHDITKIVKDEFKGVAFKKGHLIKKEDITELLSLGKYHIYVWEQKEGFLHENDAATRLKDLSCLKGLDFSEIKEGKIEFFAKYDGLFKVEKKELFKINMIEELMISTIHNNTIIKKGEKVGATKVVPLMISEQKIFEAENIIDKPFIYVEKFMPKKTAIITTGNEVFHGRIKDQFGSVIIKKLTEYNCQVIGHTILPDDSKKITETILDFIKQGAELIMCTGGMSVDPDDLTPTAIKNTGGDIISYGSPVLPGAMFLMAYYKDIPIMGLPASVMFSKRTILDLILPRVLTNEKITKETIASYGHGGICINCDNCTFPYCSFGK